MLFKVHITDIFFDDNMSLDSWKKAPYQSPEDHPSLLLMINIQLNHSMFTGGWKQRAKHFATRGQMGRIRVSEFTLESPFSVKREYWVRRNVFTSSRRSKHRGFISFQLAARENGFRFKKESPCVASYSEDASSGSVKQTLNIFTQF